MEIMGGNTLSSELLAVSGYLGRGNHRLHPLLSPPGSDGVMHVALFKNSSYKQNQKSMNMGKLFVVRWRSWQGWEGDKRME